MTQHEDLVDRLRNLGAWLDEECRAGSAETATEAADALESQSREIAALKEQVEGLCTELQRAKNALNATVHHIAADAHKTGGSW